MISYNDICVKCRCAILFTPAKASGISPPQADPPVAESQESGIRKMPHRRILDIILSCRRYRMRVLSILYLQIINLESRDES